MEYRDISNEEFIPLYRVSEYLSGSSESYKKEFLAEAIKFEKLSWRYLIYGKASFKSLYLSNDGTFEFHDDPSESEIDALKELFGNEICPEKLGESTDDDDEDYLGILEDEGDSELDAQPNNSFEDFVNYGSKTQNNISLLRYERGDYPKSSAEKFLIGLPSSLSAYKDINYNGMAASQITVFISAALSIVIIADGQDGAMILYMDPGFVAADGDSQIKKMARKFNFDSNLSCAISKNIEEKTICIISGIEVCRNSLKKYVQGIEEATQKVASATVKSVSGRSFARIWHFAQIEAFDYITVNGYQATREAFIDHMEQWFYHLNSQFLIQNSARNGWGEREAGTATHKIPESKAIWSNLETTFEKGRRSVEDKELAIYSIASKIIENNKIADFQLLWSEWIQEGNTEMRSVRNIAERLFTALNR